MRISRNRKANRYLNFYSNNYGFHKPYQVLVDGTFCFAALKNKVNIKEQIPKYFGADVKFLTTQCVILETEKLGKAVFGAMMIVKQFAVHSCGHEKNPVAGALCLFSMLGEKNHSRYIIATQDRDLQNDVRGIPGTPLLYLHYKTPTIEEPSKITLKDSKDKINERFGVRKQDETTLSNLKRTTLGISEDLKPRRKKHKSGPNPLSCKKKKRKLQINQSNNCEKTKRKRKRIKLPKHVKQELNLNK
uniref:rRNA-processing protein UTP23 homolog n=1 Tax=Clastoptera arizonana TaxID=38151 RepID=A0A1B6DG47_9HEMI